MVKERVCLGCNCIAECLDQEAKAVLWINDYYKRKAKKLQLYPENVSQYVMPGFWQTQEGFCRAKEYSMKVYGIVISNLARQMDMMHHSRFGERGWNIILGDWLRVYIDGLYDKYARMKYAAEYYPKLFIKKSDIWYIPRGRFLSNSEILQLQLCSDAYNAVYFQNTAVNMDDERYEVMENILMQAEKSEERCGIRQRLLKVIKDLICRRDVTLYINTPYLALSRLTLELLSGGRIRRLTLPDMPMPVNRISVDKRKLLERNEDYGDAFINLVYDCIWRHIPMECVEDFQNYYEVYQKSDLKVKTKIVDSNTVYGSFLFKIFVADAINHGGKLEIVQHGGNYCIEKYIGLWEFEIADKYYTWGNGFIAKNRYNMYEMPIPKTLSVKKRKRESILFVGYANLPYVSIFRNFYSVKMDEMYEDEDLFFRELQQKGRKALRVRCYPVDPWWGRRDSLEQKFTWMKFDRNADYYTSMSEAKLVVASLISTTCMECVNCDIPTIIFSSDVFFIPDENAVEILDELRKVNVVFDDPKKAANFINSNLECIDTWWEEPERKAVVSRFREMYASRGSFPKLKWIREMLKECKT